MANIHDFPEIDPVETGGFMTAEWYRRWAECWRRTHGPLDARTEQNITEMVERASTPPKTEMTNRTQLTSENREGTA